MNIIEGLDTTHLYMRNVEVSINVSRWQVDIHILNKDTNEATHLIASADSYLAENDRIWIGTKKAHEEALHS